VLQVDHRPERNSARWRPYAPALQRPVEQALENTGLKYADVEVVYLRPTDGRAAFEKGAIEAWVIWEPYRIRRRNVLGRAPSPMVPASSLTTSSLVTKPFAEAHPQVIIAP
jgi:sulfonate transport system substrate-binding protein